MRAQDHLPVHTATEFWVRPVQQNWFRLIQNLHYWTYITDTAGVCCLFFPSSLSSLDPPPPLLSSSDIIIIKRYCWIHFVSVPHTHTHARTHALAHTHTTTTTKKQHNLYFIPKWSVRFWFGVVARMNTKSCGKRCVPQLTSTWCVLTSPALRHWIAYGISGCLKLGATTPQLLSF